jgi:hypothetical protein
MEQEKKVIVIPPSVNQVTYNSAGGDLANRPLFAIATHENELRQCDQSHGMTMRGKLQAKLLQKRLKSSKK